MSDNERQEIALELAVLKAEMNEKWRAHDKRSDERWSDLMEIVHELKQKIDNRQCVAHSEILIGLNNRISALEKLTNIVGWAIGVVYGAVVVALVKHWMKI